MSNPIHLNTPQHPLGTVQLLRESRILSGPELRTQWYAMFTGQIISSEIWPGLFPTEAEQVDFAIEVGRETHDLRHLPIAFTIGQALRFNPRLALTLHPSPTP